jgi:hypothetical protein
MTYSLRLLFLTLPALLTYGLNSAGHLAASFDSGVEIDASGGQKAMHADVIEVGVPAKQVANHRIMAVDVDAKVSQLNGHRLVRRSMRSGKGSKKLERSEMSSSQEGVTWQKVASNGWCNDNYYLDDRSEGSLDQCRGLCQQHPKCKYLSYQIRGNGWCLIYSGCDMSTMPGTKQRDGPKYDTHMKVDSLIQGAAGDLGAVSFHNVQFEWLGGHLMSPIAEGQRGSAIPANEFEEDVPSALIDDLKRATATRPRASFLGTSRVGIDKVLNEHMMRTEPSTLKCHAWSTDLLKEFMANISVFRSADLQKVYSSTNDGRALSAHGFDKAKDDGVPLEQNLHGVVRDSMCREAVMQWTHHLSTSARSTLRAKSTVVPLLPESEFSCGGLGDEKAASDCSLIQKSACTPTPAAVQRPNCRDDYTCTFPSWVKKANSQLIVNPTDICVPTNTQGCNSVLCCLNNQPEKVCCEDPLHNKVGRRRRMVTKHSKFKCPTKKRILRDCPCCVCACYRSFVDQEACYDKFCLGMTWFDVTSRTNTKFRSMLENDMSSSDSSHNISGTAKQATLQLLLRRSFANDDAPEGDVLEQMDVDTMNVGKCSA